MSSKRIDSDMQPYVYAITEQVAQHMSGLDELSASINVRPLTFNERSAVERSLQVLVEAAIGCSKHYLKKHSLPVPAEARAAVERVFEHLAITDVPLVSMRGAVGMRNAIIHDYLNLDWTIIEPVLKQRAYKIVADYVSIVGDALQK
ncbi:type VII toxin-antitoxin system HepT family RNase toxin [Saccharophagus degradans]|uniref:DUF86 domain-containing protein n=1 Tax=Saccharophagus degradans TaxID=86304 RepID=A0AAW7X0R6_9GAMM|nr:DUF86 domain-containing protein [Saccharophagus degradans]MDO6421067.1 DUF86 domain-containing protein [Saccharophagus degradans]MDO6606022.1 DUF86 domain-containing protein [Saccharophagus degradans]